MFATFITISMLTVFPMFVYKLIKLQIPDFSNATIEVVEPEVVEQ